MNQKLTQHGILRLNPHVNHFHQEEKKNERIYSDVQLPKLPYLRRNIFVKPDPKRRKLNIQKPPRKLDEIFAKPRSTLTCITDKESKVQCRFCLDLLKLNKRYSTVLNVGKAKHVNINVKMQVQNGLTVETQVARIQKINVTRDDSGLCLFPILGTICFEKHLSLNILPKMKVTLKLKITFGTATPIFGQVDFSFLIKDGRIALDKHRWKLPLNSKLGEPIGHFNVTLRWLQMNAVILRNKARHRLLKKGRIQSILEKTPRTWKVWWSNCNEESMKSKDGLSCIFCHMNFAKLSRFAWHLHHEHGNYKLKIDTWKAPRMGILVSFAKKTPESGSERYSFWSKLSRAVDVDSGPLFEVNAHMKDVFPGVQEEEESEEELQEVEEEVSSEAEGDSADESYTTSESDSEEIPLPDSRHRFMDKPYYLHGQSMMRRKETKLDQIRGDSDYEGDDEWFRIESRKLLLEFSDVSYSEKMFINAWNTFLADPKYKDPVTGSGVYGLFLIPYKIFRFAEKFGAYLLSRKLRNNFLNHCLTMWEFGYMDSLGITIAMKICDARKSELENVTEEKKTYWKKLDLFGAEDFGKSHSEVQLG